MGLLNADIVKKVSDLSDKYDKKKVELQTQRTKLLEEVDFLRSAIEDDFQKQIEDGTKPDKKLQSDYEKAQDELKDVTTLLENIDAAKEKKLSKFADEVEKERNKAYSVACEKMKAYEKELATLKYEFLDKLCEHGKVSSEARKELDKFWEVEKILNLKPIIFEPELVIITDFQPSHKYSPVPNKVEINDAYRSGRYFSKRERKYYFGE